MLQEIALSENSHLGCQILNTLTARLLVESMFGYLSPTSPFSTMLNIQLQKHIWIQILSQQFDNKPKLKKFAFGLSFARVPPLSELPPTISLFLIRSSLRADLYSYQYKVK